MATTTGLWRKHLLWYLPKEWGSCEGSWTEYPSLLETLGKSRENGWKVKEVTGKTGCNGSYGAFGWTLRWRCSSMFVKDGKPVGFSVLRWAWLPNLIPLTVAKHLEPVQGAFLHQCPTDRRWKTQPWKTHARVNVLCIISYKRRSWCDLWRPEKRRKKTKKNCAAGSLQGAEYFDIGKVGFSIFCFLYAGCDSTNSSFCMRTSLKS